MIFFSKKIFLVDYLEGLIDIHNHILPSIDDGAKDIETSLEMIDLYKQLGFKGCIATPHTMEDYYGNDTVSITKSFLDFKNNNIDFIKSAASEYMMDGNFEHLIATEDILYLKDRILLTEFSYFQKPDYVNEVVFNMLQKDITPILAHPERYAYIKSLEEFQDLKNRGFELQLNLLSLSGHYGKDALTKSHTLLESNCYNYLATDAHRPEHLTKIKDIQIKKKFLKEIELLSESTRNTFKD